VRTPTTPHTPVIATDSPRFTREYLETFRGRTVPDLNGDDPRLLIVGINPGLWTAATQTHFCHPSNRFYPALRTAGLIDWELDTRVGLTDEQRADLISRGIGITNLVAEATARASEVPSSRLVEGAADLAGRVSSLAPVVVAIAGITAYRTAFAAPSAGPGPQPGMISGSRLWVIPNPSGLNASVSLAEMAEWLHRVAVDAGIV
jgi:TDG/mug DNA glycosylase family protein